MAATTTAHNGTGQGCPQQDTTCSPAYLCGECCHALIAETNAEDDVRTFAKRWPGPHVLLAVELCEAGRITWQQASDLFARSLGKALSTITQEA